jgi:hypothetical protein
MPTETTSDPAKSVIASFRKKTTLQNASIIPATKSKKEVRALGAMERLFWLMDQKHPVPTSR